MIGVLFTGVQISHGIAHWQRTDEDYRYTLGPSVSKGARFKIQIASKTQPKRGLELSWNSFTFSCPDVARRTISVVQKFVTVRLSVKLPYNVSGENRLYNFNVKNLCAICCIMATSWQDCFICMPSWKDVMKEWKETISQSWCSTCVVLQCAERRERRFTSSLYPSPFHLTIPSST